MERLAHACGLAPASLSNIENGWVLPKLETLLTIAGNLKADPCDLFVFPDHDDRHRLVESTRGAPPATLAFLLNLKVPGKN